jgi:magnesium transporter
MPFKAYYLSPEGLLKRDIDKKDIITFFNSGEGLLWVDISETTEDDAVFLEQTLGFHHLAVEDCLSTNTHASKIDDFNDYLFIVVHGINYLKESELVETAELAIFLGRHFVVSNHNYPLYSIDAIQRMTEEDGRPMQRGADFLTYAIIDTMIDNIIPTIDRMSDFAEELEEEVIRNPQQLILEAIMKLKRSTLRIHRCVTPQREVLNRLSRGEFSIIKSEAQIFYRDIYDHLVRIQGLNQSIRDRTDYALSTYLSSVANRQNETMRVLSIVATIFLPLTLLAGIYGMNFENMPELKWEWGYFAVLGIMATAISILVWRFWANNWIGWGRKQVRWIKPLKVDPKKLVGYIERIAKQTLIY